MRTPPSSTKLSSWTLKFAKVTHLSQTYFQFAAKYTLDGLNKDKRDVSKLVMEKKKASKGQDKCEEEVAKSKAIDV